MGGRRKYSHRRVHRCKRRGRCLPKGKRNPRVPMEKLSTGGTGPVLKRLDARKIVPSPPRVIIKSTGIWLSGDQGSIVPWGSSVHAKVERSSVRGDEGLSYNNCVVGYVFFKCLNLVAVITTGIRQLGKLTLQQTAWPQPLFRHGFS